jgi:hypothetical protein
VQLWLISTTCIVLFMKVLGRVGVPPRDALLAAALLALAPPFLEQAVNGEETTWALTLQLGAWLVLLQSRESGDNPPSRARLAIAGVLLALAVGARPEIGVMGLPMAWFVFRGATRSILDVLLFGATFAVVSCILWFPVVAAHSSLVPFPLLTDWRTKLAGAGYKHLFKVLPFPASVVIWGGFFFVLYRWRRWLDPHDQRLIAIFAFIPVMFAVMYVFYPTKTAFSLPGIMFLLLVLAVAKARAWLTAGLVCLVLALVMRVDLFRDRIFVGPTLTQGEIASILGGKPRGKLGRLEHAVALTNEPKTVALVWLGTDELDWLVSRHDVALERFPLVSDSQPLYLYKKTPADSSFVASVDAIGPLALWRELANQGYKFLIDAHWYRAAFSPYSIHKQPKVGDHVSVPFEGGGSLDGVLF